MKLIRTFGEQSKFECSLTKNFKCFNRSWMQRIAEMHTMYVQERSQLVGGHAFVATSQSL